MQISTHQQPTDPGSRRQRLFEVAGVQTHAGGSFPPSEFLSAGFFERVCLLSPIQTERLHRESFIFSAACLYRVAAALHVFAHLEGTG
jgi:hypothetical protein